MSRRGFTLIELLIAMTITAGVGAVVFQLFHQNERIFRDQTLIVEMQQAARVLASQLSEDIRISGQSVPPALGDIVLPGSDSRRLNLRAGFSGVEAPVLTATPFPSAIGTPVTVNVESTSGFSTGREVFLWNDAVWLRGAVASVSGSAKTVRLTPSQGSGANLIFGALPALALDEAITLFYDAGAASVRRATAVNTTDPQNPSWSPANDLTVNVTQFSIRYADSDGNAVTPATFSERARISRIEVHFAIQSSAPLSDGTRPTFSRVVRASSRNLELR